MKKRADGRYCRKIILPDGKEKHIYGKSPAEVNAKAREALNVADAGLKLNDKTLLGDWAVEWFNTYKSNLRENTLVGYRNAYNNHIYSFLALKPLREIKQIHVKEVMNAVSDKSEDLQRKILNTLRQIMDTAVENNLILSNPCMGVKITPHATDERIKFLSLSQQEQLLRCAIDLRARAFCAIGIYCGLRREEILGLMWSDIDEHCITVNRAVTFVKNQQDENHELKSKAAHRSVPIPPPLRRILDETPKRGLYVITNAKGGEITLIAFRRLWDPVSKAVDFHVTPHMLRHSYATSLFNADVDLKTAQYLLGHSDIKMTADIYTHIEKDHAVKAAPKINQYFEPTKKKSKKI